MKGLEFVRPYPMTLASDLQIDDMPEYAADYGGTAGNLIMVIIVLLIIIVLIVFLARFMANKNQLWFQGRSLRQLGGVGVGQNKSVQLVKVGNAIYVVGVGNNVQLLDKIEDEHEIQQILESLHASPTVPGSNLITKLQGWIEARKKLTVSKDEMMSPEAESFQELFHSKLQQVGSRRANLKDLIETDKQTDGERHE